MATWLLAFCPLRRYSGYVRSRSGVTLVEILVTMFLVVILAVFATSVYPALSRGVVQTRTRLQAQTMACSVATWEGGRWLMAQSEAIYLEKPADLNFSKTYTVKEMQSNFGWNADVTEGKVVEVQVTTETRPGLWNVRGSVVARVTWRERGGEQRAECEFRVAPQGRAPK